MAHGSVSWALHMHNENGNWYSYSSFVHFVSHSQFNSAYTGHWSHSKCIRTPDKQINKVATFFSHKGYNHWFGSFCIYVYASGMWCSIQTVVHQFSPLTIANYHTICLEHCNCQVFIIISLFLFCGLLVWRTILTDALMFSFKLFRRYKTDISCCRARWNWPNVRMSIMFLLFDKLSSGHTILSRIFI